MIVGFRFIQTDWLGAASDLRCFCKTALFHLLKSKKAKKARMVEYCCRWGVHTI